MKIPDLIAAAHGLDREVSLTAQDLTAYKPVGTGNQYDRQKIKAERVVTVHSWVTGGGSGELITLVMDGEHVRRVVPGHTTLWRQTWALVKALEDSLPGEVPVAR